MTGKTRVPGVLRTAQICRQERLSYTRVIKVARGCIDCGTTGPAELLDFDHRDETTKLAGISQLVYRQAPYAVIDDEIAKCDVRCRSCHSTRHAAQPGRMQYASAAARGVQRPRAWALTSQQAQDAAQQHAAGASLRSIGRQHGTTGDSIKAALRRIGALA